MARNICVDIDGTLTSPYFFIPYLNKLTGKNLGIEDYTSIDWNDTYGPEHSQMYKDFDHIHTDIYWENSLVDGAREVVNDLYDRGDRVYIVTARSSAIAHVTNSWIDKQDINYTDIFSISGNDGKVAMAEKLACDYFLEDDPSNAVNLSEAGFKVILMDAMYNRGVDGENITRVSSWDEIREILL
nr:haloacid dehalogenase-like hydrolase [uncultured Peptostreptococcus sp.]